MNMRSNLFHANRFRSSISCITEQAGRRMLRTFVGALGNLRGDGHVWRNAGAPGATSGLQPDLLLALDSAVSDFS